MYSSIIFYPQHSIGKPLFGLSHLLFGGRNELIGWMRFHSFQVLFSLHLPPILSIFETHVFDSNMLYQVVRLDKQSVANPTSTLFELKVFDSHVSVCVSPLGKLEFAEVAWECFSLVQALGVKVDVFPQFVDVVKPGIASCLSLMHSLPLFDKWSRKGLGW